MLSSASVSCTLKLSRLVIPQSTLSWSKYKYLHSCCQKILLSTSSIHTSEVVSGQGEREHSIQPDIPAAVRRTIKDHRLSQQTIFKVPELSTHLKKRNHREIGQPTPYTHPHLFQSDDEATPGIKHEEYFLRRHNLMRVLSQTEYGKQFDNHVVLLSASTLKTMSNDIPYPFHQDVDFLYLSGVNEPDALLALEYNKSSERTNFILFVKPTDPKHELWSGPVIGESAAVAYFKADEGFPLNEFNSVITERYGRGSFCVWYKRTDKGHTRNDSIILNLINSTDFKKAGQHAIEYNIQLLRVIKSDAEARIMKKSASIASQAFAKVMRNTKSGVPESHLHALLDFECRTKGAQHLSFPPVVAGGARANTLHYINNTDLLKSGDLVLMDGGCEFNAYSSDITRSWPVNGKFTTPQKELYEIVLDVQKTCLKACKPGVSLNQLYDTMLSALGKHLQDIGFISKSKTERQVKEITTDYCPHHLGHYLGMDTHDTPLLHRGLPLQPGMAFTLEPGLYIPKYARHVPERYRGIGIRIEDDILLTNDGPYVLTAELPKEVDDIETLLASEGKT